jgi:hypothetical protein
MKKFAYLILALCLLVSTLPAALATEPTEVPTQAPTEAPVEAPTEAPVPENTCGEGLTWAFADGVLTVNGDGAMYDFEENAAPWHAHRDEIEEVDIRGKVTYIGAYAFADYDALLAVNFGDALYEIGKKAFRSCDGLEAIWLPESFKIFGERSFESCKNLSEIHCSGKPLTFKDSSMWDTWVTIYYPAERPWSVEYIPQLVEALKGRIQFLASDGTDHYVPTEPPTEPEETVPETTVPETSVPETESAETETVPAETELPAEPPILIMPRPTTGADETEPEPQPLEPAPESGGNGWLSTALLIAGAVLMGVGLGRALFGRKKGKYAR